jgi:hypothetical protein
MAMNTPTTTIAALAVALALSGPARCADTETDAGPIASSATEGEDLIWGDAREVFAALLRSRIAQVDTPFEEGDYIDEKVELRPFPKDLLPALNPFSELDLHVVISKQEAAVVLPRTRRVLKVYRAPEGAAMQPAAAPAAQPEQDASATQAAPEPARRAPPVRLETAPAPPSTAADDGAARTMLERAEARRKSGDILATRQFLEHASRLGSAEALDRLAETYDPKTLAAWGARGVRPDAAKAEMLYAQAKERRSHASLSARTDQGRDR